MSLLEDRLAVRVARVLCARVDCPLRDDPYHEIHQWRGTHGSDRMHAMLGLAVAVLLDVAGVSVGAFLRDAASDDLRVVAALLVALAEPTVLARNAAVECWLDSQKE